MANDTGVKGVSKVGNLYRAYAKINGEDVQVYSPDQDDAAKNRRRLKMEAEKSRKGIFAAASQQYKKRSNADQTLPVGVYESHTWRERKHSCVLEKRIISTLSEDGEVIKNFSAMFDGPRTPRSRDEAVKIVLEKRARYCRIHGIE